MTNLTSAAVVELTDTTVTGLTDTAFVDLTSTTRTSVAELTDLSPTDRPLGLDDFATSTSDSQFDAFVC